MLKHLFHLLPINIQIRIRKKVTLLYKDAGFGDTLMITSVIDEIKRVYGKKTEISVNGIKKELLENNPNVLLSSSSDQDK